MKQTQKKHAFHLRRVGLLGVLFVAFFIVRLDAGKLPGALRPPQVLAYATEMTRNGLLSSTNSARASQGLSTFASDGQLDTSAQAKAQDMVNKDYWAHVAPDGTEPWYFFNQAGYSYSRAGENLAYGFMSSQATIDGWMNSATHRDNMLGVYSDVGFGIINAPSYQGTGEQTLVVAHYGTRSTPAPAPAPVTNTPLASSVPGATVPTSSSPQASSVPAAKTTTPAPPTETANDSSTPDTATTTSPTTGTDELVPVQTASMARVSVLSMLGAKTVPIAAVVSLVIVMSVSIGYALTHRKAFHHALVSGEHFVVAHPGIDTAIIAAVATLILTTTYGTIG